MAMALRKPIIGVLFISPPRFHDLGAGTKHGCYWERKEQEAGKLLSRFNFADTVFPGIVYNRDDMDKAIQAFQASHVDMVFAHFLSWSDDFAWIRFLRDMSEIPVLFASITREQPGFEDSLEEDRFIEFLSAGGLVGALEASGSATRFNRPMMRRILGGIDDVMEETRKFARAACLRSVLRKVSFGLLPSYNEAMWSTYVDPYDIFMKVGPELRFITIAALEEEIESIPKEKTEAAIAEILKNYPSGDDIRRDKLFASVEASLALEAVARKTGVELIVLNDIDQVLMRRIGLRPGFTPCPGTDDVMVVPEGDLGGGLACYLLKKLSGDHVNFIEPFYIDRRNGTFAAGHAGPNDYTDPLGSTVISTDARFAKSSFKHAGAPFAWNLIGPGEKTMVHISQCNGRFKIVCSVVDALKTNHFLSGYSHGLFKSRIPAEEFFAKLIDIGVTQHYGLVAGDFRAELKTLAQLLDFDYTEI